MFSDSILKSCHEKQNFVSVRDDGKDHTSSLRSLDRSRDKKPSGFWGIWGMNGLQRKGKTMKRVALALMLAGLLVCTGSAVAATGGPDAFGYRFIDSEELGGPTYNFEDISSTGTRVSGFSDDNVVGQFNIGFNFEFYGNVYSTLWMSSNCFLFFGDTSQDDGCCSSEPIPGGGGPNNAIFGWYEDIYPPVGDVYYETLGTEPNRRFLCQWQAVQLFGNENTITLEYKLFEADNSIEIHYQQAVTDDEIYTVGIENADESAGLQYYRSEDDLPTPRAVKFMFNPGVVSILPEDANPTAATDLNFLVSFSENVTGVDATDFTVSGDLVGGSITSVTQLTPATYRVLVASGDGEGEIRVNFIDDDSVVSAETGDEVGGEGAGNGSFFAGVPYTIDRTPPTLTSITRVGPTPTTSLPVDFLATFSEPVDGVDTADFEITTTGPLTNMSLVPASRSFGDALDLRNNDENSGNYLNFGTDLQVTSGAMTIEAWVYWQRDGKDTILGKGTSSSSGDYILQLNRSSGGKINFYAGGSWHNSTSALTPNEWTHIAVTYDQTNKKFYINGAEDASYAFTGAIASSTGAVSLGRPGSSASECYDGLLDDVRLWNIARTQAEIQETMNTTLPGAMPGLLGYWRFDAVEDLGAGSDGEDDIRDYSGNDQHGDSGTGAVSLTQSVFYGLAQYYRVRVDGDGGSGTIALTLRDNDSIVDYAQNVFGGPGAQDQAGDEIHTLDTAPPAFDSVQMYDATHVDVVFDEYIGMNAEALNPANYTLTGAGQGTLASNPDTVTLIETSNPAENIYRLGWSTGALAVTGDVTITVSTAIKDISGFDVVAPLTRTDARSNPAIESIVPISSDPAKGPAVQFRVWFTENVYGFDASSDLTVSVTGTVGYTDVAISATYLPRMYEVTVSGVTGDGTMSLAVPADVAVDAQDNLNVASEAGVSTALTIDNTPPVAPTLDTGSATASPTNDTTPTWAWVSGGSPDSAGLYRYDFRRERG